MQLAAAVWFYVFSNV